MKKKAKASVKALKTPVGPKALPIEGSVKKVQPKKLPKKVRSPLEKREMKKY